MIDTNKRFRKIIQYTFGFASLFFITAIMLVTLIYIPHSLIIILLPLTIASILYPLYIIDTLNKTRKQLEYYATHDQLTGLINRMEFEKILQSSMQDASINNTRYIVCYLDLDNFKIINDTASHAAGDALLQAIAGLLQQNIRKDDLVARLGGDEFGILLTNCSIDEGKSIGYKLIKMINSLRFSWDNKIYRLGASIGMVLVKSTELSANQLLSAADVSCHTAKISGRNQINVYQSKNHQSIEHHREIILAATLQEAIDNDRLIIYVQHIVSSNNHQIKPELCEILIRLGDETNKLIGANVFIPTAEHFNLMTNIDRWVLTQLLSQYDKKLAKLGNCLISINLSADSLNDQHFLEFLLLLINQSAMPASRLCFELTETAVMHCIKRTSKIIKILKNLGCKITLDDFGTGFNSFNYLKNFEADFIKIDGLFVSNIVNNKIDLILVRTINNMAHELGMQTIAEYVTDRDILQVVSDLGVDYVQGFVIGEPLPLDEVINN